MYKFFNPNPIAARTKDCVIRAISAIFGITWDEAFDILAERAKQMGATMDENAVYGSIMRQEGFYKAVLPASCPDCFTAGEFADTHPVGDYILGFDGHVAALIDGVILDSFDCSDEIVYYYWAEQEGD